MRRILLDTCAYSAMRRAHPLVADHLRNADEIGITPVVIAELLFGFNGGTRERENRAQLQAFLRSPRVHLLGIDEDTAECYALIARHLHEQGTPLPAHDIWIAASAMQHGLLLVTTDTHFARIPQVLTDIVPHG